MNQRLYIRDRKMHAAAPGKKPRHVDRREWHIERKVQWFPLPWLAMGEPGKLLCIAVKILNLESASVDVHDVLGRHWSVSREEHLPFLSLLTRLEAVNNDHLDLALETHRPDNRRIECYTLSSEVMSSLTNAFMSRFLMSTLSPYTLGSHSSHWTVSFVWNSYVSLCLEKGL